MIKKLANKIKENIVNAIIIFLITSLGTAITVGFNKVKKTKQDFINLQNAVMSLRGAVVSSGDIVKGEYHIKYNNKKIPVYIILMGRDHFVEVEDEGAGLYLAGYYYGRGGEYYYIKYEGEYTKIYEE